MALAVTVPMASTMRAQHSMHPTKRLRTYTRSSSVERFAAGIWMNGLYLLFSACLQSQDLVAPFAHPRCSLLDSCSWLSARHVFLLAKQVFVGSIHHVSAMHSESRKTSIRINEKQLAIVLHCVSSLFYEFSHSLSSFQIHTLPHQLPARPIAESITPKGYKSKRSDDGSH